VACITAVLKGPTSTMSTEISLSSDIQMNLFDGDKFAPGYSLPGFTEVDKSWMIGVPHVITAVTFWTPKKGIGHCSVEAYVGTAKMLERQLKREKIEELSGTEPMVDPEEAIVYSDGSTGIRRQLVSLFAGVGMIEFDKETQGLPTEGKLGESQYDTPWTSWATYSQSRQQGENMVPSFSLSHTGTPLRIAVNGGLMRSAYSNDTGDSATFYLR